MKRVLIAFALLSVMPGVFAEGGPLYDNPTRQGGYTPRATNPSYPAYQAPNPSYPAYQAPNIVEVQCGIDPTSGRPICCAIDTISNNIVACRYQ